MRTRVRDAAFPSFSLKLANLSIIWITRQSRSQTRTHQPAEAALRVSGAICETADTALSFIDPICVLAGALKTDPYQEAIPTSHPKRKDQSHGHRLRKQIVPFSYPYDCCPENVQSPTVLQRAAMNQRPGRILTKSAIQIFRAFVVVERPPCTGKTYFRMVDSRGAQEDYKNLNLRRPWHTRATADLPELFRLLKFEVRARNCFALDGSTHCRRLDPAESCLLVAKSRDMRAHDCRHAGHIGMQLFRRPLLSDSARATLILDAKDIPPRFREPVSFALSSCHWPR